MAISHNNTDLERHLINYRATSRFEVRWIKTPYNYLTANHNSNEILFNCSSRNTFFFMQVSDRYRFSHYSWDNILKQYDCVTYPQNAQRQYRGIKEDIFVLYTSECKMRKINLKRLSVAWYRSENWGIYTRKYLETIGGFNLYHNCHDCAETMMRYFIESDSKFKNTLRIILPSSVLNDSSVCNYATANPAREYARMFKEQLMYKRQFFSFAALNDLKTMAMRLVNYTNHKSNLLNKRYKVGIWFWLKQNLLARKQRRHGYGFALSYYKVLRTDLGYKLILWLLLRKYQDRSIVARITLDIMGLFTERAYYELLKNLMLCPIFKEFIQSDLAREIYNSGWGKESIDSIAQKQRKILDY